MKESLNDIIARLDKDNKSFRRDLVLIKESITKSQELSSNKIDQLNADSINTKKSKDKDASDLKEEIEGLKVMIKVRKPNPIKALTDKDVNSLIDARVTESYITNKYRNK
tara:strand:- start:561 stop:890 length:330 start_codon:yes stop_codon:yes gene_type:complete